MRKLLLAILFFWSSASKGQEQDHAFSFISKFYNDSVYYSSTTLSSPSSIINNEFADFNLTTLLRNNKPVKKVLGYSARNKPIEVFYFPGTSSKKALIIGGVYGSELSAVEVAKNLITKLTGLQKPYYSVIIIPVLFPDNTAMAEACKRDRITNNVGRYSNESAIDPNRQLPSLGAPFYINNAVDAYGRAVEKENQLLLQLIQAYSPQRIVNLHAIKDYSKGGIYADPRTDCKGVALGYSSDSTLAVVMAKFIDEKGGNVAGNKIKASPTTLYYLDPKAVPIGAIQERNLTGATMRGKISGVSLGSWASTAVCDEENGYERPAMRLLTVEFPGYKKPAEYRTTDDKQWFARLVDLYAASIYTYFLQEFAVENFDEGENSLVAQ